MCIVILPPLVLLHCSIGKTGLKNDTTLINVLFKVKLGTASKAKTEQSHKQLGSGSFYPIKNFKKEFFLPSSNAGEGLIDEYT